MRQSSPDGKDRITHAAIVPLAGTSETKPHAIAEYLLPPLLRQLSRSFPFADRDIVHDGLVDAFMDYLMRVRRCDCPLGESIDRFLYRAAWRNVANLMKSDARRRRREAEYARRHVLQGAEPCPIPDSLLGAVEHVMQFMKIVTTDGEHEALELWCAGERRTAPLARALRIDKLPVRMQQKEVKRFKDRNLKRAARLTRRQL